MSRGNTLSVDNLHTLCYNKGMKLLIMTVLGVIAGACVGIFTGFILGSVVTVKSMQHEVVSPVVYPTGYEIFEEANKYRSEMGLAPLIMSDILCNNIAERAINYEKTNSHAGFSEWVAKNHIQGSVSEILASGLTAEETINKWKGSPSHDRALLSSTYTCAYSDKGYSVMILQ